MIFSNILLICGNIYVYIDTKRPIGMPGVYIVHPYKESHFLYNDGLYRHMAYQWAS